MDVTRKKSRAQAPGMTSPLGIEDGTAGRSMAEAQAAIEELYSRLNALKDSTGSVSGDTFDDTTLQRKIRVIHVEIEAIWRRVKALERKFPIFRQARVVEEFENYIACVRYNPVTAVEGAAINVAKPWGERDLGTTDAYTVGDQILIAITDPYTFDDDGRIVRWEVVSGGVGGFTWIDADTFALLPSGAPDGSWGRTENLFGADGIKTKNVKNGDFWFCLTHWT